MIADDEKDHARRNELLTEMVTKHTAKAPMSLAIARIFLNTVFAAEGERSAARRRCRRSGDRGDPRTGPGQC